MRRVLQFLGNAFRRCDKILLLLCLVTTAFGYLVIASTTQVLGSARYVPIQIPWLTCTRARGVCRLEQRRWGLR